MTIFEIIYWIALLMEMAVRAPLARQNKLARRTVRRVSTLEKVLFGLLSLAMFVLPLVYTLTPWLDFANYSLPDRVGWLGVSLLAAAVYLFYLAHRDLQNNWSPSLEIYEKHRLVTSGIYSRLRHPMYASQWLWSIAQILLLQNWIAGPVGLLVFIPFYFIRVRAEEQMMLDTFGDKYRKYMDKVGGVIPKLG